MLGRLLGEIVLLAASPNGPPSLHPAVLVCIFSNLFFVFFFFPSQCFCRGRGKNAVLGVRIQINMVYWLGMSLIDVESNATKVIIQLKEKR